MGFDQAAASTKRWMHCRLRFLRKKVNYVLDADIRGFFDNLDIGWMLKSVQHRVADPRILRLIQKWLKAGVMEEGKWSETEKGTPQGSVITA